MPSFSIHTLGCKLNQLESEALADAFRQEGWELVPWDAPPGKRRDSIIINTCTVTSRADQKARKIIRRALADNPGSLVVVTGCYAQVEADAVSALEGEGGGGRLLVAGGGRKSALLDLPARLAAGLDPGGGEGAEDPFRFNPAHFSFHSRPFLKIQDGCSRRCSFCRVSIARGKSRSLEPEKALAALKALEEKGAGEAVLTGVNLNQYRREGLDLGGFLAFALEGTSRIRLRLSSLEPESLRPELLAVLADPRIQPHFHLSIQSGSPFILERMRRPYGPEEVEEGIARLRSIKEDPFLACDIITGFPGESPEEFEKTYGLCRRIGFAWIHAFPYSPRPGTEALSFGGAVPEREAAFRVEKLTDLARRGRGGYAKRWINREVDAVFEAPQDAEGSAPGRNPRSAPALSANYLKLRLRIPPGAPAPPGRALRCRILAAPGPEAEGAGKYDAEAELVNP